ncbi:MAG: redoxin domain-containing protein [Pseudomonadota bacterium]
MTASTKALLIIIAIAAFGVGFFVHSEQSQLPAAGSVDSSALLSAQLLTGVDETTSEVVSNQLRDLNLVNFWASWCAPCREEMPMFESMFQLHQHTGFQVIGIAIDHPDNTQAMLDSMGITYPILYAEQTGMTLMDGLGNRIGGLPFTLLINKQGEVLEQKLGQVHEEDITNWIQAHL